MISILKPKVYGNLLRMFLKVVQGIVQVCKAVKVKVKTKRGKKLRQRRLNEENSDLSLIQGIGRSRDSLRGMGESMEQSGSTVTVVKARADDFLFVMRRGGQLHASRRQKKHMND